MSAATPNPMSSPASTTTVAGSAATPAIPDRPASLTAAVNQNAAAYSRPYAASPYGSYGSTYSSPYGSPYSRMGAMGGMGGYGGGMYGGGMYGGGYGGYGGGMYGGGMYGGGMPGMPGDPNNPESLTQRFNTSTMATFQMLEGVVGAFGGFAQMLESTYMATHSSFFGKQPPQHATSLIVTRSDAFHLRSNGLRCRAVQQPPRHPRLRPRHLHPDALDPDPDC